MLGKLLLKKTNFYCIGCKKNDEHQEIFNTYQEVWKNCLPDEQLIFNSSKAIDKIEKTSSRGKENQKKKLNLEFT